MMGNRSFSQSADYRQFTGDEAVPATVPVLNGGGFTTLAARSQRSSVLTNQRTGAKFACLELLGDHGVGLHFVLTPDGARAVAESLNRIAADIDAVNAAAAKALLERIAQERGGQS